MNWILGSKYEPSTSGEYLVIGESITGKVMKDLVDYIDDDGWQIGNNWDIIVWKKQDVKKC